MGARWLWVALLTSLMLTPPVHAQTCAQKAELLSSAEVYRDLPRYVTGLGWQGARTDRLPANSVVWVCQDRAVDFGFSSKTWSQVGYRAPRPTDPWRFGWILKEQWRPVARKPTRQSLAAGGIQLAAYPARPGNTNSAPTKATPTEVPPEVPPHAPADTPPDVAPDAPPDAPPNQPPGTASTDNADTPPTLPASKSGSGAVLDTPPESASLGEQIVLYGPLFLAMLLGMLAKALFDLLDDSKPSWREHLRHGAMAIVISPIVFLGFITAGQFNSSSQTFLVLALFAFQNGFFWQTVLKRNPPAPEQPA
ncbi:hypothetical protein JY96_09725 [Aquabacterium sp. NJ1]|uniref:hypothetical protein n=1 Tax=Aquabacterium sp. NJ1 TaxID=1538295 RepID=UPI00052C59BE|nr:hypothetical protein [Aquabacterium sp. NJ1]KGM40220.1 hypothetical protein JY96_09725 [Aquabacterium sp. NJ1]